MNDYGKGGILGAATVLPATSAITILLREHVHPAALVGFCVISIISFIMQVGLTTRYLINRKRGV